MSVAGAHAGPVHRVSRPPRPSRVRRILLPLLLFLVIFVGQAAAPSDVIADSSRSTFVASEIVHHGDLDLTRYRATFGDTSALQVVDGRYYPLFPWAPTLAAVPIVVGWGVYHHLVGGPTFDQRFRLVPQTYFIQVLAMSWVVALTALVLFWISRRLLRRLEPRRRDVAATAVALVFAFCTAAWSTASRSLWQHGPSMLCLSLAVLFALKAEDRRRNLVWLGAAAAGSYMMRPTDGVVVAILTVWVLVRYRSGVALYLLGALPLAALFVAVSEANYGTLQPAYYRATRLGAPQDGYQVHFLRALAGNLVSPGRGIFIFMPFLLLSVGGVATKLRERSLTTLDAALIVSIIGVWLSISAFPQWWGGNSYGPRLFSDMVPFFMILCLPVVERLALPGWTWATPFTRRRVGALSGVLVLVSFLINFEGATMMSATCWDTVPHTVDSQPARVWSWSNPQFLAGFRGLAEGIPHQFALAQTIHAGCPPGSAPS